METEAEAGGMGPQAEGHQKATRKWERPGTNPPEPPRDRSPADTPILDFRQQTWQRVGCVLF